MTKYPFFRVTSEQPKVEDLDSWFKHFEGLGIPCAIVRQTNHKHFRGPAYAVWRAGHSLKPNPSMRSKRLWTRLSLSKNTPVKPRIASLKSMPPRFA